MSSEEGLAREAILCLYSVEPRSKVHLISSLPVADYHLQIRCLPKIPRPSMDNDSIVSIYCTAFDSGNQFTGAKVCLILINIRVYTNASVIQLCDKCTPSQSQTKTVLARTIIACSSRIS